MPDLRYAHSEGHTDLCYSSDFKYIITCGSEGDVRAWEGIDDVNQKDTCVGEKAWAVAQKGSSLYVGTDTNIIQAYTFPDLETDGILTRFTAPVTQIDVSSNGRKLVAGSCDMTIHIIDINSMDCIKLVGHKAPVLSVCFDPKNEYVVSSGCDGAVKIWSLTTNAVLKEWECLSRSNSFESAKSLCRMHFKPGGFLLAIPAKDSVRLYERGNWNQVQTFGNSQEDEFSVVRFSCCGDKLAVGTNKGDIYIWDVTTEKLIKKEHDENKQAITGIAWRKDSLGIVFCNVSGQLGDVDVPFSTSPADDVAETRDLQDIPLGEPEFDDDDDDDNAISIEKIKSQSGYRDHGFDDDDASTVQNKDDSDDEKESVAESVKYRSPVSELQPVFQPSSTPIHLQERFMVWNSVGIIRQFNTEDLTDIDVEFHDTSNNYGFRLNNLLSHTMGTLTPSVVVLACSKTNDENPSKLVCVVLKSWDGQKEWDCNMLENEEIICVAAGDYWVAAAVDSSTLRIFSLNGSQIDIFSVPGKLVTMVGHKNKLSIVFHSGVGFNGDQYLSYCELKINPNTKLVSQQTVKPLPLSAGTKLRWLGYTDEGSLSSVDSNGTLRILYGSFWRPVCLIDDQCKSKFDHYFVVGINEATQTVRCILCKGAYYPPVLPKPLVAEVKWQIPLCELDSEKGQLEEEYLRYRITLPSIPSDSEVLLESKRAIEKSISISVMKLFALACRSGLEARAISLCEAMPNLEVVKLAAKYALKLGKQQLAQKVNEIASKTADPVYELEREEEMKDSYRPSSPGPSKEAEYSQDLFEETAKENLILKMQQKKANLSPKPLRMRRPGNPFKKEESISSKQNTSTLISSSEGKGTFMEWYSENHKRLQDEFPFMKEGELAVAGMKQFKQQLVIQNSEHQNSEQINSTETVETKKRKAPSPDERRVANKKKLNSFAKLKTFSFNKN